MPLLCDVARKASGRAQLREPPPIVQNSERSDDFAQLVYMRPIFV